MASISWPTKFPAPLLLDYGLGQDKQFLRTPMDSGAIRQRRQYRSALGIVNVKWRMKTDVYRLFEGWFVYKINAGTDWFNMKIPSGEGFNTQEVRFTDSFASKLLSHDMWEVSGNLDVRDMGIIDESTLDTALV